jgi:zinc-ribbon domain
MRKTAREKGGRIVFCPRCAHENPDEAQFCGNCGAALPTTTPSGSSRSVAGGVGATGGRAVSSELKIGIIIGTLFIPLLGIILGIVFMNDALPEKNAVGRIWLYTGIGAIVLYCFVGGCLSMLANV